MVSSSSLILTLTRACNLRCSYCPTVKDDWPTLDSKDVDLAISLFLNRYKQGDVKLFGGEPMLVPNLVQHAIERAESEPNIRHIYLSTNGLGLSKDWLDYLQKKKKVILTLSLDGKANDHRTMRVALSGIPDSYDHVLDLLPELLTTPRLVITQTIPPKTALRADENFQHLLDLGFRRFNFLPGYFLPWKAKQLNNLENSFSSISRIIRRHWQKGRYLYIRNLFVFAPTPFFNTGLIVDSDRSIHPSNVGLSAAYDHLRTQTKLGDLNNPPTKSELDFATQNTPRLLEASVPPSIWRSTLAADKKLSEFCQELTPAFLRYKKQKQATA